LGLGSENNDARLGWVFGGSPSPKLPGLVDDCFFDVTRYGLGGVTGSRAPLHRAAGFYAIWMMAYFGILALGIFGFRS